MRQTTVYVPENLKKRLEQAAQQSRQSEAAIVREALEEALARRDVAPNAPCLLKAGETQRWLNGWTSCSPSRALGLDR